MTANWLFAAGSTLLPGSAGRRRSLRGSIIAPGAVRRDQRPHEGRISLPYVVVGALFGCARTDGASRPVRQPSRRSLTGAAGVLSGLANRIVPVITSGGEGPGPRHFYWMRIIFISTYPPESIMFQPLTPMPAKPPVIHRPTSLTDYSMEPFGVPGCSCLRSRLRPPVGALLALEAYLPCGRVEMRELRAAPGRERIGGGPL